MRKIATILAGILVTASVFAQSPDKMSYQAVIRDVNDKLITDQSIDIQISILQGTESGSVVYVETQTSSTNTNGLASLEIGSGTLVSGDFTTIDWADGPYFIKTEINIPTPNVSNPTTGKTWMDRNLGASQVATSSTDAAAYGDYYQWGRGTDGHEKSTSSMTSTQSSSDIPGHGDFVVGNYDWRSPKNDDLWQGVNGVNNPCPSGYRLPTRVEWVDELKSWSSNNAAGAFNSPLKLPLAGKRSGGGGSFDDEGFDGYYWSSKVNAALKVRALYFFINNATIIAMDLRTNGYSVRCIKD